MVEITRADLDRSTVVNSAHYNMGRKGYGYGYRCLEYPRLSFINRTYRPSRDLPDGKREREWYVDGARVADLDAAVAALNMPPVLTEDEQRILDMIPIEPVDLRELEDELAGAPHPENGIMPDTPHARVMRWLEALRDKGMVEYGRREWGPDENPETRIDAPHLCWSSTIRRRTP